MSESKPAAQQPIDEAALTQYVVEQLGKHASRDNLIFQICHITGMSWPDADAFVREVETQQGRQIALRQSPLFIILGVGILIGGCLATAYSLFFFISLSQVESISILSLRSAYREALLLLTGLGMLAGGSYGLWRAVMGILGK